MLSQTLQSITNIKLRELQRQRDSFSDRKARILAQVSGVTSKQEKIYALLEGVVRLNTANADRPLSDFRDWELDEILGNSDLSNIRRFVNQSQYDPSVPTTMLDDFDVQLHELIGRSSLKLDYADLYSRLLTEWLSSDVGSLGQSDENASSDGEFELIERQKQRLIQLSEKFQAVVFSPGDADVDAINGLLAGLFASETAEQALNDFRKRISSFGSRLANEAKPFNKPVLEWCIKGLLQSELLSDHKKNALEDFIKDKIVLAEIADVLNMRFKDLRNWSWDAEEGIPVAPRRQLNGKYRVVMVSAFTNDTFP